MSETEPRGDEEPGRSDDDPATATADARDRWPTDPDGYTVRPYRPADRERFLELHRTVFGGRVDDAWFRWKYEDNPYADHVPVFVAERDGELAGARPLMAMGLCAGGEDVLGLQPSDTMVHPDHRRRGLFTRMTAAAVERYAEDAPGLFFNFPNDQSGAGYLKMGWRTVGDVPTGYALCDPGRLLANRVGGRWNGVPARLAALGGRGYARFRDRQLPSVSGDVTVRRYPPGTTPVETMADLYRERVPDGVHAVRDETFYAWRFDNPTWAYATYVASRDGEPVGACVVGEARAAGVSAGTRITDVLPLEGIDPEVATALLVATVTRERPGVLAVPTRRFPADVLDAFGVRPDDAFPLSRVGTVTQLVTRPLSGAGDPVWEVGGVDVLREKNWTLSFAEQDTS